MAVSFQFHALEKVLFSKYFKMNESELKEAGATIFESDKCPCYPCRVSLTDAAVGESVLAVSYEHNAVSSPYRASGPIFIRANAERAQLNRNEVPELLSHRLLSIRGYSHLDQMVEAETAMGHNLEGVLLELLNNRNVEYIHVHNAGPGCFNCAVTRA